MLGRISSFERSQPLGVEQAVVHHLEGTRASISAW